MNASISIGRTQGVDQCFSGSNFDMQCLVLSAVLSSVRMSRYWGLIELTFEDRRQ